MENIAFGLIVPLLGTTLGAACVFFFRNKIEGMWQNTLNGFAAGVMVAASIWSLIIPSMESTGKDGFMSVFPAIVGFLAGMLFLLVIDTLIPHQHPDAANSEGPKIRLTRTTKLLFAITIHNIPEGMAVGVAFAAALDQNAYLPMAAAIALAVGIAIQNFPEGAIVSMPLKAAGNSSLKSFWFSFLAGAVEPVAMIITILVTDAILPLLPYVLSFAAGAMMYVVVEELIPETQKGRHSNLGTVGFALGFVLMMVLDVVL